MRVLEAIRRPEPSVSFEFYPPQQEAGQAALLERARDLDRFAPDFVSVTYGAQGARGYRREASFHATAALAGATRAARVAHLTLAGHTREELDGLVRRFVQVGAEGFMALRGDPPGGPSGVWEPVLGGLRYASELVELIKGLTTLPIGVAAFPHGHPTARSLEQDSAVLAAKQAAGAAFALTQVVFDPDAYSALVERSARAGATLPLVPGVMPVTAASKIAKLEMFSGAPLPAELARALSQADDAPGLDRVGLDWSVRLARELLARGAPGVHFYTLNSAAVAQTVCAQLGLRGAPGPAAAPAGE